jgi:hypothetical protein
MLAEHFSVSLSANEEIGEGQCIGFLPFVFFLS